MAGMCRLVNILPGVGFLFLPHGSGRLNSGCQLPYSLSHFSSTFSSLVKSMKFYTHVKLIIEGASFHVYKNQARLVRVEATELSMGSFDQCDFVKTSGFNSSLF